VTEKNYKKTEKKFFSTENVEEGKALDDTRKYEFGFISGMGTKFTIMLPLYGGTSNEGE
ncbi:MAG: hypothetical protein HGA23_05540, partial [Bacteroidales bacterium]|nr:hypothetical protein [Bacteroidales bacterium]